MHRSKIVDPYLRLSRIQFGIAAASRNTSFQASRYGFTWTGLAPALIAPAFAGAFSLNHLVEEKELPRPSPSAATPPASKRRWYRRTVRVEQPKARATSFWSAKPCSTRVTIA